MGLGRKSKMVADEFSIEAKQDSSWTLAFTILGVTLLLSLGFFYYYFGPTLSELTGDTPDPTASEDLIPLKIGDVSFLIPASYTRFPRARRGGQRDEVALYALLPDFEPYSSETKELFENNAPDSPVIYFEIISFTPALTEKERLERVYMENVVDRKGRQGPYGFRMYQFMENTGYKDEDLFVYGRNTDSPVVIRCYRETELIPSPHCRRDLELTDTLLLSYRYKRPWLAQWRAIDQSLRAFVLSLRVPSPTPKPPPPETSDTGSRPQG